MEIIRPPIQGTTLITQSPPFSSTGIRESSIPFCAELASTAGIRLAFSTFNNLETHQSGDP